MKRLGLLCLSLVTTIACSGCGGGGDLPDLGHVEGVVTMNGTPLANAMITFKPAEGRPSSANTDASGRYELIYAGDTPGALIGKHNVSISTAIDDEAASQMIDAPIEGEEDTPSIQVVGPRAAPEAIPAKYNSQSELTENVSVGSNTIDFKLTSE